MSDQQSQTTSSVVPNDSVSNAGNKKKNRPGKAQRLQARGGFPTPATSMTSAGSKASASSFAAGVSSAPIPQPGKFPIVFQTGAGEPTRDVRFAYSPETISQVTSDLEGRYVNNARFAEFSTWIDQSDAEFGKELMVSFLLSLAQQTVHTHVNMGLPQGDFSPLFSTDVYAFAGIRSILSQFGEFQVESLGTRFLLSDYASTVQSLVHAASKVSANPKKNKPVIERLWLPMSVNDKRTKFLVAQKLNTFLSSVGVSLDMMALSDAIFNETYDVFEGVKPLFGDDDATRDRFDFLFSGYTDAGQFVTKMTSANAIAVLSELGLPWNQPSAGHLDFHFNVKETFSRLADEWSRKKTTITKFFSCGSGLTNRAAARGSTSQLSSVTTRSGITVINTLLALAAQEFSLLACFPSSAVFEDTGPYNVVVTTSIPVSNRATEFLQLHWL